MDPNARINAALQKTIATTASPACPPRLAEAIHYAVFPGGHRIRPRLCLAVASAYPEADPTVVDAAICSIELLHCASLVHDDMPCFDDAITRRGKSAVHVAYGEPTALLCGDALIVMAFQSISSAATQAPRRAGNLLGIVSDGVGAPNGIVAGQGWECESDVPLDEYQRAKTGVLFAAATMAGAAAVGTQHEEWGRLGECIGEAYQIADDLMDCFGDPDVIGKPVGQDAMNGRPNAVHELGEKGAMKRLRDIIEAAVDSVPHCPGMDQLRKLIQHDASQIMTMALNGRAAA